MKTNRKIIIIAAVNTGSWFIAGLVDFWWLRKVKLPMNISMNTVRKKLQGRPSGPAPCTRKFGRTNPVIAPFAGWI